MRLLDRYLLRELLKPLALCLGGFLIFWIAFDLIMERIGAVQDAKLSALEIAWYYILRLPELLEIVMPIGLLLGMLWALTTHAKSHELTAIRAAGVSVWRLAMPYLAVGFTFTVVQFLISELWQPRGSVAAENLIHRRRNVDTGTTAYKKLFFKNTREGRYWALEYNQAKSEMRSIQVNAVYADGSRQVFVSDRAIRTNDAWGFFNVRAQTDLPGQSLPTNRIITNFIIMPEFTETPEDIKSEIKISQQLSNWKQDRAELPLVEIVKYLQRHQQLEGSDRAKLYTKLWGRLASPWRCLVVVLIALPFGAASGRRNVFVGVASGIFICFAYVILLQFGMAVGAGGYLPPWLAAWLPNLLFGAGAVFYISRVR